MQGPPRRAAREKAREAWLIPPRARDVEHSDDIPIREQEKVKQSVTNPPAAYDVERSDDIPIRVIPRKKSKPSTNLPEDV